MGRFSLGAGQAIGLVACGILIGVLGYAAIAIMSAPSDTDPETGLGVAAGEAAAPPARPAEADAAAGEGADGGLVGGVRGKVNQEFDSKVYIYKTKIADQIVDGGVDPLDDALTPGFDASVAAIDNALPPFLQGHVPWLSNYAKYVAVESSKDSLGGIVEDEVEGAAMGAKPGFLEGDQSASAPEPASDASAAAPASALASSPGAASASPEAAGGVMPAAMGGGAGASDSMFAGVAAVPAVWSIRMGRFATLANAEQFAGDLARRGVSVRVEMVEEGGRLWSVVQHGRFASRGTAEGALRKLSERGYGGSVISESTWGGAS